MNSVANIPLLFNPAKEGGKVLNKPIVHNHVNIYFKYFLFILNIYTYLCTTIIN